MIEHIAQRLQARRGALNATHRECALPACLLPA